MNAVAGEKAGYHVGLCAVGELGDANSTRWTGQAEALGQPSPEPGPFDHRRIDIYRLAAVPAIAHNANRSAGSAQLAGLGFGVVTVVQVPDAKVALSTASVYPESTAAAFEMAARLGYDGVEVMVTPDPVSQDVDALRKLSDYHGIAILAIHAPCLIITRQVWGTEPWGKLVKARDVAEKLGSPTVVVHPPFRWQREYARDFITGIERMAGETSVRFAVENMFPLRARGRAVVPYSPDYDPSEEEFRHFTLDLSHTAVSQSDALAMAGRMGERLTHIHIADGMGTARDEHLVPGRGNQPCAELLENLAVSGFDGTVVVEINSRRSEDRAEREADVAEALAFTRLHLVAPAAVSDASTS
jgi:sugar phosphate isomerase/epimerase